MQLNVKSNWKITFTFSRVLDIEGQIAQATTLLQETQRKIDLALAESQKILASILEMEERSAECDVLLNRYNRLAAQYKADIQRLSLIVEELFQSLPFLTLLFFFLNKNTN